MVSASSRHVRVCFDLKMCTHRSHQMYFVHDDIFHGYNSYVHVETDGIRT